MELLSRGTVEELCGRSGKEDCANKPSSRRRSCQPRRHGMMRPRILKKLFKIYEWISTPLDFVVHNQKQFFKNTYHSLDSDLLCTTKSSTESRHNGKSTNGILKNNDKSIKIFGLNLPRKTREFKYWKRKKIKLANNYSMYVLKM